MSDCALEIVACGECAGCSIDESIRSALNEINSFYEGRAIQMRREIEGLGFVPDDYHRRIKMLRFEWSESSFQVMKLMRPVGCLRQIATISAAHLGSLPVT